MVAVSIMYLPLWSIATLLSATVGPSIHILLWVMTTPNDRALLGPPIHVAAKYGLRRGMFILKIELSISWHHLLSHLCALLLCSHHAFLTSPLHIYLSLLSYSHVDLTNILTCTSLPPSSSSFFWTHFSNRTLWMVFLLSLIAYNFPTTGCSTPVHFSGSLNLLGYDRSKTASCDTTINEHGQLHSHRFV